jgi:beta-aspartyl-peptidase (threonine type)
MRPTVLAVGVLIGSAGCLAPAVAGDRAAILAVLAAQADAWNRGDLDAFLEGYWRSDRTVFASGGAVHRGFEAMAKRYRAAYPSREKMGRLSFSNLEFERLEGDRAVVTGSWELDLGGTERRPGGVFTLIWHRFADGWKIVHDHTSSRP